MALSSRETLGVSKPGRRIRPRFGTDDRLVAQVRRGDETAFEIVYERYRRQLLAYCRQMLGSPHDAEDALQATFTSAHRALMADDREIDLRPWLYTIARNACQNIIRRRRRHPQEPMSEVCALHGDPVDWAEQREEVARLLEAIAELPELQQSAIVLAELHGLRHREIGSILGITAEQVKSQVFQARANLISEREARTTDCREIQAELAQASGAELMRSRLRRHLKTCEDCRAVAGKLGRARSFGLLAPLAAVVGHWRRVLGIRWRASTAAVARAPHDLGMPGGALELGGGGMAALAVKVLAGLACLGAGTRVATLALGLDPPEHPRPPAVSSPPAQAGAGAGKGALTGLSPRGGRRLAGGSSIAGSNVNPAVPGSAPSAGSPQVSPLQIGPGATSTRVGTPGAPPVTAGGGGKPGGEHTRGRSEESTGRPGEHPPKTEEVHGRSEEAPGKTGESPGRSGEAPGKTGESPGKSGEAPGKTGQGTQGKSAEAPGKSGEAGKGAEAQGKSGETHGAAGEAPGHPESAPPGASNHAVQGPGPNGRVTGSPPGEK